MGLDLNKPAVENFLRGLSIAFLYLVRYKVVGFKAEGKGQRAEVECTPLI